MIEKALEKLFESASVPDPHGAAALLISKYHTLDGVFSADETALSALVGERVAMLIKLTAATVRRRAEDALAPGTRCSDGLLRLELSGFFCGCSVEMIYLISLGDSDEILAVDLVGEGAVNSASITSRSLLDVAIRRGTKRVIIVHNHPAGVAEPSSEDVAFTDSAEQILASIGVKLLAHYVVAGIQCKKID
jgi:DNA repair protein RadC